MYLLMLVLYFFLIYMLLMEHFNPKTKKGEIIILFSCIFLTIGFHLLVAYAVCSFRDYRVRPIELPTNSCKDY